VVNEKLRIGLYGSMPMISYSPSEDWNFSLRGLPGGGVWNITADNGDSKSIDLTSYYWNTRKSPPPASSFPLRHCHPWPPRPQRDGQTQNFCESEYPDPI